MQIIPVIDLMQGVVVRGVAGRRDTYRPIVSRLVTEPTPGAVARAFQLLGFNTVYVADLDAITGGAIQTEALRAIVNQGLNLWLDAGGCRLGDWFGTPHCLVVGTETLNSPDELTTALNGYGSERIVLSLDLKAGQPLTKIPQWQSLPPVEIAHQVIELGVRRIIVLDLARVGVGQGTGTEELCRAIRRLSPDVQLIAGGGVRNQADLDRLADAGCNAALVASALHDGLISNF